MNKLAFLLITLLISTTLAGANDADPNANVPAPPPSGPMQGGAGAGPGPGPGPMPQQCPAPQGNWRDDTLRFFTDGLQNLCMSATEYVNALKTVTDAQEFCNAVAATGTAQTCFHHVPSELQPAQPPSDPMTFCMALANVVVPAIKAGVAGGHPEMQVVEGIHTTLGDNGKFRNALGGTLCYAASRTGHLAKTANGEATCHHQTANADAGATNAPVAQAKKVRMLAKSSGDDDDQGPTDEEKAAHRQRNGGDRRGGDRRHGENDNGAQGNDQGAAAKMLEEDDDQGPTDEEKAAHRQRNGGDRRHGENDNGAHQGDDADASA